MNTLLSRYILALFLSLLSLSASVVFLTTANDKNDLNVPVYIAWLTISSALVYFSLCMILLQWLRLRKQWSGKKEKFDKASSSGKDESQSTFYWCGSTLREGSGSLPRLPSTAWPLRSSSLLPLPLPPPSLAPLDLAVPSPAGLGITSSAPSVAGDLLRPSSFDPERPLSKNSSINLGTASQLSLVQVKANTVEVKTPSREQVREATRKKVEEMRGRYVMEAEET